MEKNGPKAESSLSVRGKKGIARNRMSLSATNKGVVNGTAIGEIKSAKPSFLDDLSVNGNATFNFKANSCGHSTSVSTNDHQSRTNHGERQPSVQAIMEAQESSDMVEGGDDGSSQSKVYSDGVEQIAEFQFSKGNDVVAKKKAGSSHDGSEQMEFEEEEGVGPPLS